jgi:hypothetical protein
VRGEQAQRSARAAAVPPAVGCAPARAHKKVAVVQSNYIPWKGYFDLMARVDEFVLYDDVQYTRRDWRNRNRLKTPQGVQWLTIPVQVKGRYLQRIDETFVSDPNWSERHWATLEGWYSKAPYFSSYKSLLEDMYKNTRERKLSAINRRFLQTLRDALGIDTPLSSSSDYPGEGRKTERLLSICRASGATHYLSGPAAREYLDEDAFATAGIAVEWMSYEGYPEYPQLHPPFEHAVSVLDLLLNVGERAPEYMLGAPHAGATQGLEAERGSTSLEVERG